MPQLGVELELGPGLLPPSLLFPRHCLSSESGFQVISPKMALQKAAGVLSTNTWGPPSTIPPCSSPGLAFVDPRAVLPTFSPSPVHPGARLRLGAPWHVQQPPPPAQAPGAGPRGQPMLTASGAHGMLSESAGSLTQSAREELTVRNGQWASWVAF